jgi:hypothetical protein
VLGCGFTENRKFGAKTDWNSIFLGQDPCIAKRLSITVPYLNFYGFWKISHFRSKFIGVSLRFYRKLPDWGKNRSKLCISWSRPPYSESVIYNAPEFQFLLVFEKFHVFARNPKVLAYGFTIKCQFGFKNWSKLRISGSWPPYCESVIYNGPVFLFLRVLKNFKFLLEIHGC